MLVLAMIGCLLAGLLPKPSWERGARNKSSEKLRNLYAWGLLSHSFKLALKTLRAQMAHDWAAARL